MQTSILVGSQHQNVGRNQVGFTRYNWMRGVFRLPLIKSTRQNTFANPLARSIVLCLIGMLGLVNVGYAQKASGLGYTEWLNRTIDDIVAARINQRSGTNQTEAPSISGSSTSLVDHSSSSDLVGLAMNPPTFPRPASDEVETTSQSFTITPYTLFSALNGGQPLEPFSYQKNKDWRQISFTVGFEEEETAGENVAVERTIIGGAKLKIWDPRRADADDQDLKDFRNNFLAEAGGTYSEISNAIQDTLFVRVAKNLGLSTLQDSIQFINNLGNPDVFESYLNSLGEQGWRDILQIIEDRVEPFLKLNQKSEELLAKMRQKPQVSLSLQGKSRQIGRDEVKLGAILDYGLGKTLDWTLNAGFEFRQAIDTLKEHIGLNVATELSYRLSPLRMSGAQPITLTLSAQGVFLEGMDSIVRLQAKTVIPIANGINLPLSVTWANRSELIEEEEIRGRFGFSIDTSRLLAALNQ